MNTTLTLSVLQKGTFQRLLDLSYFIDIVPFGNCTTLLRNPCYANDIPKSAEEKATSQVQGY